LKTGHCGVGVDTPADIAAAEAALKSGKKRLTAGSPSKNERGG